MPDNVTVKDANSVATEIAADLIAGVKYQRVKLTAGADGTATDVSDAAPLPVTGEVELGATTLAALETISAAGPLTDAQLRAAAVPISLDAAALAALESITAVGPLTDAELRATAVPISLDAAALAALESITAVGPLTDAELRATAVPVSVAGGLTAAPLVRQTQVLTLPGTGGTYAAQDEVSDAAAAGSVVPIHWTNVVPANGGTGYIVKAQLDVSTATVTNGVFRLWLFNAAPSANNGNDAPFVFRKADKAKRIGYVDFALITEGAGSDGAYALDDGLRLAFTCDAASRDIYGILVAKAAYVWTAAQTFDVTLEVELA